ncbi:hypothetical protein GALL_537690 [mine drainage metagenome]|uniref:Uncharacterized protein n=1 Tax=mine drainage metagenome TaxID=410659 RepID=A0A1J5P233_9ZZZZ
MADRCQPCEDFSVPEQWPNQAKIVEVRAPFIRVVKQISVARFQISVLTGLVDHRLDRKSHRANEDRQSRRALHQGRAGLGVVKAMASVVGFGNDRIERRAIERRVHLVGDLDQTAIENGKQDRIDRIHLLRSGSFAPRRLPRSIISGVPISTFISLKSNMRSRKG